MDRSLFPQGVEVDQGDLKNEADQVAFHVLERFTALGIMGVRTGLALSVNGSDPSRFDLSAGDGFAANGELVELDTSAVALALASSVAGSRSYVVLFYAETTSLPGASAVGGAPRDRRATRASRLEVLSETSWLSLVPSADDLSLPASERACLVGVVTAPAVVGGALTTASFSQVAAYVRVLSMPQPSNITGVTVLLIDPAMPITERQISNPSARIELDYAVVGTDYRVRFRPPGSTTYGDWVTVTAGGTFTVYSSPGSTGPLIRIAVTLALLPTLAASTSVADDLPITALYEGAFGTARLSAHDIAHRSQIGAGLPSATNPHGIAFGDLSGEGALRSLVLGRGFQNTAAHGVVPRLVFEGQTLGAYTLEEESSIGATTIRRRTYREHASGALVETVNARWSHLTTNWNKDLPGTAASMYRQSPTACEVWGRGDADDTPWTDWRTDAALGSISTIARLNVEATVARLATTLPRHNAPYPVTGAGARVLVHQAGPSDGAIQGGVMREYRSTGTTGTGNPAGTREVTINASWNGSAWQRDQAVPSYKFEYGRGQLISIMSRATNAVAWADNNWETMVFSIDAATGVVSATDFAYLTAPTRRVLLDAYDFRALETAFFTGVSYTGAEFPGTTVPQVVADVRFTAGAAPKAVYASLKNVPDGASITQISLNGTFTTVSADPIVAGIVRTHRGTRVTEVYGFTTEDWVAYPTFMTENVITDGTQVSRDILPAATALELDWSTYVYYLWVAGSDAASASAATMTLNWAEVLYTTVGPQ